MKIHPTYAYPNGLDEKLPRELRQQAGRGAGRWRWAWRGLLAVVGLLAAVVAAWVLSNWRDAAPQPLPPELALPMAQLAPERNVYFALSGLAAAADRDPAQVGRQLWAASMTLARQMAANPPEAERAAALQAAVQAQNRLLGPALPSVQGGTPWVCDDVSPADCLARDLADADKLSQQRQSMAALGARCDALLDRMQADKTLAYEEPWPEAWHMALPVPLQMSQAMACGRWMRAGAVLAYRQGRRDEVLRQVARDLLLVRAVVQGGSSLVAQVVAHRLARQSVGFAGALAAQDPLLVPGLLPLLTSFGPADARVRRLILYEAAFGRAALAGQTSADLFQRLLYQPQRTQQWLAANWVARLQTLQDGVPALLKADSEALPEPMTMPWTTLLRHWRNPMGRWQVDAGRGFLRPYLARFLDLELHREAVVLALNAQRLAVPAGARAAWSQEQPMSDELRQRLSWPDDGRQLTVRTHAEDRPMPGLTPAARDRIDVLLDRAAAPG